MNRLNLDFSLSTMEERRKFLDIYINKIPYPTEEELEIMANYILWGKDIDGKSPIQKKEIQIKTRNGTWDKKNEESLDALLETPTFNENLIIQPTEARQKIPRETFSRKESLEQAPEHIKKILISLFNDIDKIDLILNFYDLKHGKRKNPPRKELTNKFSESEINLIKEKSEKLNQFKYLKLRHLLVELRREQFTIRDTFLSPIQYQNNKIIEISPSSPIFEFEIPVYPLGLLEDKQLIKKIFPLNKFPLPQDFSDDELKEISELYWKKKEERKNQKIFFDFSDIEHVYNLLLQLPELKDEIDKKENLESTTDLLLKTLLFYIKRAKLTDLQYTILRRKIQKVRNQDIANEVNRIFNKSYTANYISTIFRQKIIKQINKAAIFHEKIVENLFFPENFKVCNVCGEMLLKDQENFVRKSRSKDGFSNRCKECDKKERHRKKGEIN